MRLGVHSRSPGPIFEAFLHHSIDAIELHASTVDVLKLLQQIAWKAMERGRDTISTNDIETALETVTQIDRNSKDRLVDRLVARGLLVSELDHRVRFIHRTVLEYLTARELAERFSSERLPMEDILSVRRWDNAIAWSVSLLPRSKLSKLISQVCEWDLALALKIADSAEVERDVLLNAILSILYHHPPKNPRIASLTEFVLRDINFSAKSKRRLRILATHPGPLSMAASAALIPHMTKAEMKSWIGRICNGELDYNQSSTMAPALSKRLDHNDLVYFLDTVERTSISNLNDEDYRYGIEALISELSAENRNVVRDWARGQNEALRTIVAAALADSEIRDDCEFLIDQWTSGTRGLSYPLYSQLKFGDPPYAKELFGFTKTRLDQLRQRLLNSDDRRWPIELLCILARESPTWRDPIVRALESEHDEFLRRAFRLALAKNHKDIVSEVLREFQSGATFDDRHLNLIAMFEPSDWQTNANEIISLFRSDNAHLVHALGDELMLTRNAALRALTNSEIDQLLDRVLKWQKHRDLTDGWWARDRILYILSKLLDVAGSKYLLARANDAKDPHRKIILGHVLPRVSSTLITTNDLTEESCRIMLKDYVANSRADLISNSPGAIATETFIEQIVLPAAAQYRGRKKQLQRLENILIQAGERHGRRYQIEKR